MKYQIFIIFYCCAVLVNAEHKNETKIKSKNNHDNHINVALETVLEFNKKDQRSDIQLINNVQQFLDKVKNAITPSTTTTEAFKIKKHKKLREYKPGNTDFINNNKYRQREKNKKNSEMNSNLKEILEKRIQFDIQKNHKINNRFKKIDSISHKNFKDKKYAVEDGKMGSSMKKIHDPGKKKAQDLLLNTDEHLDSPKSIGDFVLSLATSLQALTNDDIQTVIETADDEIKKFRCATCNVEDATLIRRSMTKGIDVLRRTPLNTIRDYIQTFLDYSKNANDFSYTELSGAVNFFFGEMDKFLYHIKPKTEMQMKKVATDFRNFLRTSMNNLLSGSVSVTTTQPPKKSLVEIVRNAIRTMIFDNYSSLETDKKNWIKAKLKQILNHAKPKEDVQESLTNKINNGFKHLLRSFFQTDSQGSSYFIQGITTSDKMISDTTTRKIIAIAIKNKKQSNENIENRLDSKGFGNSKSGESWKKLRKPILTINDDNEASELPEVASIRKKHKHKSPKKKGNKINWDKKIKLDKKWKLYFQREAKDKNKIKPQNIDEFEDEIDLKWKENKMKNKLKQKETYNVKSNPIMKTSAQDYLDEIDTSKENVIDEDISKDDDEGIRYIQQELPQSKAFRNQNAKVLSSSWHRRADEKDPPKGLNTQEEGLSIEFIKTNKNNPINKTTKVLKNNKAINKNTDVFIPKNFDYAGKQLGNIFAHTNDKEANSKTNNIMKSNGLYIPKSRRDSLMNHAVDIVHTLDTHPVPPIHYEFSEKAQKPKIPKSTSINVKKNYLSTLFTTKGSSVKDMNNQNTLYRRSDVDKTRDKVLDESKNKPVSKFLIENISQLEENFAKYQKLMKNEEIDDEDYDDDESIERKTMKNNINLSSTTIRPKMPSTKDILNRINPDEAIDRSKKLTSRRQGYEYSDLY